VVTYLSRRLVDAKTRYTFIEKLCLCLFYACIKCRCYLLSSHCTIASQTDVIKYMLQNPIMSGRIGKWAYALVEYDLAYEPFVGVPRPGGPLGRRVSVAACPSPDGSSARASAKGGGARRPETGVREVGIPRPSCSSRAQVGCACSRGLQASTREREASGPKRAPVSSSSPRGRPSLRGPWSFLL
jgi:hypothetical protein